MTVFQGLKIIWWNLEYLGSIYMTKMVGQKKYVIRSLLTKAW